MQRASAILSAEQMPIKNNTMHTFIFATNNANKVAEIQQQLSAGYTIVSMKEAEIDIDIPERKLDVRLSAEELANRRTDMESLGKNAYKPLDRKRHVSKALQIYAMLAASADTGAVRVIPGDE